MNKTLIEYDAKLKDCYSNAKTRTSKESSNYLFPFLSKIENFFNGISRKINDCKDKSDELFSSRSAENTCLNEVNFDIFCFIHEIFSFPPKCFVLDTKELHQYNE